MSAPSAWLVAWAPLAAALAALAAAYAAGFDQRAAMPPDVAGHFYGFFLDRYPLFAFAIAYGLGRILVVALAPGRAGPFRRLIGGLIGLVLVLAVSLHPTFGGFVLRAGFGTGGGAFLNGAPMPLAYAAGSAAAAAVFGLALGLGVLVTGRPGRPPPRGRLRGAMLGLLGLLAGFLALWFAAAVIGIARDAGLGPWPRRPLDLADLALAAGLIVLAGLPHALLVGWRLGPARRIAVTE